MQRLLAALTHPLSPDREPRMERRLYQLVCLASTVLSLGIVVPMNVAQDLSPWLNLVVIAFGLGSLGLYALSRRGVDAMKTYTLMVSVVLNLCWFTDAGSQGSIGMFFFAGVTVLCIFFRGRQRVLFLLGFVANVVVLLTVDHVHPGWSIPFRAPLDRYWDLVTGFLVTVVACVLILWVLVSSFDSERKKLLELNQALQQSLDEIHTLRGMLPICGWCKKVRDDEGLWTQVDLYLAQHTDLSITHGLCPECSREHFPKPLHGTPDQGA